MGIMGGIGADEIQRTAVVGGGLMGAGIAQILAQAGCQVRVVDLNEALLEKCMERVKGSLATFARHGLIAEDQIPGVLSRIEGTTSLEQAAEGVQFAIEAVVENLPIKQELFEKLDRLAPVEAILATNTSGLRVGDIAERTKHPERVVGSHFFYPHTVVPLVEVGYGLHTSDEVVDTTVAFWKRCGKDPVVCRRNINGFLVNRLQSALAREAMSMVQNGVASARDVDRAMRLGIGLRLPMVGILEQRDWGGLDVHCAAASAIYPTLENTTAPLPFIADRVGRGEIGAKVGKGIYDWTGKDVEMVRRRKQQEVIKLVKALREIMPEEDDLVENV